MNKPWFLIFLVCVLAVPTCGVLMDELTLPEQWNDAAFELLRPWLMVGVLLGLAHLIVRPLLRMLTLPLRVLTLGLFGLAIDVFLIYLCDWFIEGFSISGPAYAILTSVLVSVVSTLVTWMTPNKRRR